MTLLKALLPLAALLLLSVVPTETKVVNSIAECNEFFLNNNPPNIPRILEGGKILRNNRYKPICQTFENTRTFVTLYDTKNRIPVFSAAKFRGSYKGEKITPPMWMIEPQLEDPDDNDNMRSAEDKKNYNHQAGLPDYKEVLEQGVNKGHLLPSSYGFNQNEINATFTLTNIVPQNEDFNHGRWSNMEQCIRCVMNKYCHNNNDKIEGYVLIGAQPNKSIKDRLNIPSMLWSAFCCYSNKEKKWLASAHWGDNIKVRKKYMQTVSLNTLNSRLGKNSEVFPGPECPLHTTVTELYPKLGKNCKTAHSMCTTTAPAVTIK